MPLEPAYLAQAVAEELRVCRDVKSQQGLLAARRAVWLDYGNVVNGLTHQQETVHTYGWYLRKHIAEARAKGMTPILCTSVSRLPRPGNELDTTRFNRSGAELNAACVEEGIRVLTNCPLQEYLLRPP